MPKNAKTFYCEICDFTCSKKSNYENHLNTAKHGISNDINIMCIIFHPSAITYIEVDTVVVAVVVVDDDDAAAVVVVAVVVERAEYNPSYP